jgi:hypothetical protein
MLSASLSKILGVVEMNYSTWWKTILTKCDLKGIYDQGLANCHHKENKKKRNLCSFETCPKIPKEDKERDYSLSLQEKFAKWDKGECTYSSVERALLNIKEGEKINKKFLDMLGGCTICPIGNASCIEFFKIIVHGNHPEKSMETRKISICTLGCDSETCILNK